MAAHAQYDVVVVGGGPAGMMAAGRAAELGARVLLLEKNEKLGKKLLITGGGRCNITNAEFDVKKLIAKYGPKGKALFGSFARFGVEDTLNFFNERSLATKVEAEKRAFPASNKAEDVWKTLVKYMQTGKVEVMTNASVVAIDAREGRVTALRLSGGGRVTAKSYIVATGGTSRPETGSTGDGFAWLRSLGHLVEESDLQLVPVKIKESWVRELAGVSFPAAKLSVFQDGKKQESRTGKLLLTHFGISGPLVLNMSKSIADLSKYGSVQLELDLYPDFDLHGLDKHVLEIFGSSLNKQMKNVLGELVQPKMVPTILELTGIKPTVEGNSLTKEARLKLVQLLKGMPMTVSGFLGVDKAIVASGGVSLKEVDFKTMQSKRLPNLYLAGDILNFDRPSGGYSLQICWTTGFLAGEHAAANLKPIPL